MARTGPTLENSSALRRGRKYFSLGEAQRALPLVKRIAADIQVTQSQRIALHAELTAGADETDPAATRRLQDQFDAQTTRLEELIAELGKIGVDLKDPARALLDFPAVYEGREILLCWQANEPTITTWHEVDGGYAGRRPVSELHE